MNGGHCALVIGIEIDADHHRWLLLQKYLDGLEQDKAHTGARKADTIY